MYRSAILAKHSRREEHWFKTDWADLASPEDRVLQVHRAGVFTAAGRIGNEFSIGKREFIRGVVNILGVAGRSALSAGMQTRAYRDYLRRKFPDRFRALFNAESTEQIIEILKSSRSKDSVLQHLLRNPERVRNWLEAGRSVNKNLEIEVGEG